MDILERIDGLEAKFHEVSLLITDPSVIADQARYVRLNREYRDLERVLASAEKYKKAVTDLEEAKFLFHNESDADLREMAREVIDELEPQIPGLEEEVKLMLLPQDPEDGKNVVMEIRAGAGGEEAALFAGSLLRMYTMYAEAQGFKTEVLSSNPTELGGYKEVSFEITGDGAYSRFKFESGVHRVQRVPETESQGRIQTSTATVAVLPEADEVEFEINQSELKIDTFRSSGAGGQHINKTESAIRITHLPTGIVVCCQNERSQHQNKDMAMKILMSKLAELKEQEHKENLKELKGDYSMNTWGSQIRSYVFDDRRVKDHRTGHQTSDVNGVMDGRIDGFIKSYLMSFAESAENNI